MTDSNEPQKHNPTELGSSVDSGIDSEQLELKLPGESSALKDIALWAGVLALLTFIAFWPVSSGSFIWRDDTLSTNKELFAPTGLVQSWVSRWQGKAKPDASQAGPGASNSQWDRTVYQPVSDTAYWLEYRLGGHTDKGLPSPMAFHVAAIIFHTLSVILLWLVLRELLVPASWVIAAVFAVHPIHTEPIAWISQQATVLSGLFFIAATYTYLMYVKARETDVADRISGGPGGDPAQIWGTYVGAAALCLAAMLASPGAMIVPLVILTLLWWKKRVVSLDGVLLLPLFLVGLALWFANVDLHRSASDAAAIHASPLAQASLIGALMGHSLVSSIVPIGLSVLYPQQTPVWFVGIVVIAIIALIASFAMSRQIGKGAFCGLLIWMLLTSVSVNWFDGSRSGLTDSAAYLAVIPLIVFVAIYLAKLKIPGPQPQTVVGISAVIIVIFGGLAWARTYAFDSPVAMWRDVLKKNPRSSLAEASLAEQLRLAAFEDADLDDKSTMKQELIEAKSHAQAALALDPSNSMAERTWANTLVAEGDIAKAIPHFDSAATLDSNNPLIRTEYASSLIKLGRYKESLPQLNEALKLDVTSATTHRLLGEAYASLGEKERGINEYQSALLLDPADFLAREKLAELQTSMGLYKPAIESYTRILTANKEQQNRADIWVAIAKIKEKQGEYDHAVEYLEAAFKLAPDDAEIKKMLDADIAKRDKAATTRPATTGPSTRATS